MKGALSEPVNIGIGVSILSNAGDVHFLNAMSFACISDTAGCWFIPANNKAVEFSLSISRALSVVPPAQLFFPTRKLWMCVFLRLVNTVCL